MSDTTFIPPTYPPGRNTGPTALRSSARGGGGSSVMSGGGGSAPATITLTPATACGNGPSYTPYLERIAGDCGPCLRLRWIPSAGSGARSITWERVGCGEDANGSPYIEFATADPLLCTDDDAEECGENKVVVRVTCDLCEPITTECCPSLSISRYLCVTFSNVSSAGCECFENTRVLLSYNGGDGWYGNATPTCNGFDGNSMLVAFLCQPGTPPGFFFGGVTSGAGLPFDDWDASFTPDCGGIFPLTRTGIVMAGGATGCDPTPGWTFDVTIEEVDGPATCPPNFPPTTYNCVNGTCTPVYDGSGEFATEAACETVCEVGGGGAGSCSCGQIIANQLTPTSLYVPDGANVGTHDTDPMESWAPTGLEPDACNIQWTIATVTYGLIKDLDGLWYFVNGSTLDRAEATLISCTADAAVWSAPGFPIGSSGNVIITTQFA